MLLRSHSGVPEALWVGVCGDIHLGSGATTCSKACQTCCPTPPSSLWPELPGKTAPLWHSLGLTAGTLPTLRMAVPGSETPSKRVAST